MNPPKYPRETYNDNPPLFKRWIHIYAIVVAQFVATLLVLHGYPSWF